MTITITDWPRISTLFDEGAALAPDARPAWLRTVQETDPGCAAFVRQMLEASDARSDADLHATQLAAVRLSALSAAVCGEDLVPGAMLGAYRLVEPIGHGGMASVWLAEQTEGVLRRVALKIPHLGLEEGSAAVERFIRERDFLAALEHPNIARLYDAGTSDGGVSYLAMESVSGVPITVYCDERRLDVAQRLSLFDQVLTAVGHAHSHLVIHRDLKAGNILVAADGQVKLLDFGIAGLLDDGAPAATMPRAESRALTPEVASPEQLSGQTLSTSADVYSLGVVMYQLLTGRRPYQLDMAAPDLATQLRALSIPAPSQAGIDATSAAARGSTPVRLRRLLAGDLDAIVMQAMQRDVTRRYATVAALAADLQRWRSGLPVHAHPGGWRYRTSRFIGRYRREAAGAALVSIALLGGAAAALMQAREARMAERKAVAVKDFMLQMLTGASPGIANSRPPKDVTVQQLLDVTSARAGAAFADQPEVRAELLLTMGEAYETLDLSDQGAALLRTGLALERGSDRASTERRIGYRVALARVLSRAGRIDEAGASLDEADAEFVRLGDSRSLNRAIALELRGSDLLRSGRGTGVIAQAEPLLLQSAALYREHFPDEPGHVNVLLYLADVARGRGDPAAALRHADTAVTLAVRAGDRDPLQRASAYSSRGSVRLSTGDYTGAASDHAAASALHRQLLGADHLMTLRSGMLLARALVRSGQAGAGMPLMQQNRDGFHRTQPGSGWDANAASTWGQALLYRGDTEAAASPFEESRRMTEQAPGEALPRSAATLGLADVRMRQGRYDEAQRLLDEALAVRQRREHRELWSLAEVHLARGLLALHRRELTVARTELDTVLQRATHDDRPDLTLRLQAQAALARLALAAGDAAAAEQASAAAARLADEPLLAQEAVLRALALDARGQVQCAGAGRAQGLRALEQAQALLQGHVDARLHLGLADTRLALGRCQSASGQPTAAAGTLALARATLSAHPQVEPLVAAELAAAQVAK